MSQADPGTLITCHANADWDATASLIGALLLYPGSVLVFPGTMERPLNAFFNDVLSQRYPFRQARDLDPQAISRIVIVDTCQPARLSHVARFLDKPGVLVEVWDHHPPERGDLVTTAYNHKAYGATSTLLAEVLRERDIPVGPEEATILGAGIYGDTGAFTYSSTTPKDLEMASWLLERGMDVQRVSRLTQQDLTSAHIKLLGELIGSAAVHAIGNHSIIIAEARMDNLVGDFAVVVQRFMDMEHCQALFALGIMDDRIQVIARSNTEAVDVGAVCKGLGGGGHSYAASASVKDKPLPELKDAIFQRLYAQLNPHRTARDLLSSPAVGIAENSTLLDAETVMTRYGLKAAPILKRNTRHCVGLLDFQTAALAVRHGLGHLPVRIYMQRKPITASPDAPLQTLMDIIVGSRQRLVPIVEHDDVIGVVTRTDLINLFVQDEGRLPLPRGDAAKEKNLARMLETRLPRQALALLRRAGELGDALGVSVYAVGGFVRDVLLARPGSELDDVDLVVEGDGLAFARALAESLGGRLREHQAFLTAVVIYNDAEGREQRVDVATARLEYYLYPVALPTVELSSIKMDLFRRDFTINAMAIRLNAASFGSLVDFFGGQNDVQRKAIRVLHALSFVEDPTRILRAVRFAQRYAFHLAAQTSRLIKNALDLELIDKLSGRRIVHEFVAVFKEKSPLACFDQFDRMGILKAIHPALVPTPLRKVLASRMENVLEWYKLLYLQETVNVPLAYLLVATSGLARDEMLSLMDRLELTPATRRSLLGMRKALRGILPDLSRWQRTGGQLSELCAMLDPLPIEGALYLMARAQSEVTSKHISQYINRLRHVRPDITGKDLAGMGLTPGPLYGKILKQVWADKLDGKVRSREEQLALAGWLAESLSS